MVDEHITNGFGRWVYQNPDGSLGLEWRGTPPSAAT